MPAKEVWMETFNGKVVIITGGAYGIGRATALEFAKEGASVTIADVDDDAGRKIETELGDIGNGCLLVQADVSRSDDCKKVVSETVTAFGGVDILFNNVGIQSPSSYLKLEDTPEDTWDRILDVTFNSCFRVLI